MKVTLVNQMGSIEDIANIASICYGNEEAKNPRKLFETLIKLGHTSVLEHMVFTFKIEGISRACLGQLTRHRIATFTVESQRYVKYDDGLNYVTPEKIQGDIEAIYMDMVNQAYVHYMQLLVAGMKPEDARYILPNATETNLFMTINLRSLINFLQLRLDKSAQAEIRCLAKMLFYLLDMDIRDVLKSCDIIEI